MTVFNKKSFRKWLDVLCKVTVKARDNYTCQRCKKQLIKSDFNTQWCHIKSRNENHFRWNILNSITMCGTCHQWAHANPAQFGVWFSQMWPISYQIIYKPYESHTWRESDYRHIEEYLIGKAMDYEVDPETVPLTSGYRKKFVKRIRESKGTNNENAR